MITNEHETFVKHRHDSLNASLKKGGVNTRILILSLSISIYLYFLHNTQPFLILCILNKFMILEKKKLLIILSITTLIFFNVLKYV